VRARSACAQIDVPMEAKIPPTTNCCHILESITDTNSTTMRISLLCLLAVVAINPACGFTPTRLSSCKHCKLSLRSAVSSNEIASKVDSAVGEGDEGDEGDEWIANLYFESQELATKNILDKCVVGPSHVLCYDTSLRDGTQGESIAASCEDKLKIATRLAQFDMDYIEAGWPGSNPKDAEFFARAQTELSPSVQQKLVAFGSTRRKNIAAKDDKQIQALVDSQVPNICMVAKAHPWQVTEILRCELEENINMISDSVSFLVGLDKTVLVDLEHFFDGYKSDPGYAMKCCEAAADAGAKCLVLCDTNGGSMPWEVAEISQKLVNHFQLSGCTIGIHCHNDCGMAAANSVSAANAGVGLIQGTVNGIGERTGNADLCSIIPSLALHVNSKMTCRPQLNELTKLSRFVDEILNRTPTATAPFVGSSAFAHKGGLHVAAMERSPLSYQHVEPELVGNEKRILISELSGRQNILGKMEQVLGSEDSFNKSDRALAILNRVKELENQGYTFEGAEASVHLMILHGSKGYCPPFSVLDYSAQVVDQNLDSASRVVTQNTKGIGRVGTTSTSRATVKVRTVVENPTTFALEYKDTLEVSDGNGPVDALAQALMRALLPSHPDLAGVELVDYKVRILDPQSATGAATRVMIEFRDSVSEKHWTTVSVDRNVISASLNALVDGLEYALIEHATSCMLCEDAYDEVENVNE
jgi:2-isopropylmalate synthase